jgi:hypothetical protein
LHLFLHFLGLFHDVAHAAFQHINFSVINLIFFNFQ